MAWNRDRSGMLWLLHVAEFLDRLLLQSVAHNDTLSHSQRCYLDDFVPLTDLAGQIP